MAQRLYSALTAETVKAPEQHAIELTPGGRREHLLELLTVSSLPACTVNVPPELLSTPG